MRFLLSVIVVILLGDAAMAQDFPFSDVLPKDDGTISGRIVQGILLLTVLSIAPGLLITTTCFTRFVIAFSFLRSGLGLQSTPSNLIVISLAIFMTYFVMSPVFEKAWEDGVQPLLDNQITNEVAFERVAEPLKGFMLQHVREKDIELFEQFSGRDISELSDDDEVEIRIIVPAFLLSEIRRGFEIGFLILLPFLVIDLVVSTVTMSMGMMMLPPTVVSLPFKILFLY